MKADTTVSAIAVPIKAIRRGLRRLPVRASGSWIVLLASSRFFGNPANGAPHAGQKRALLGVLAEQFLHGDTAVKA